MLQSPTIQQQPNHFLLKDQLKQQEISILQFLFNSQFQLARQRLQEKLAIHTEIKKYQRSVSINSQELRRLFHALSSKLHEKYLREDSECLKALNKLETLWEVKKIEIFHRYFFVKYIESSKIKFAHTLIQNEDHLMRMEQHIYFSIEKAIWARQACLNHLKRQMNVLGSQDVYEHLQTLKDRQIQINRKMEQKLYKVYGYRAKYILDQRQTKLGTTKIQMLSQDINNYRKLTYHLIELISNWKMYIQSLTTDLRLKKQKIQFYKLEYNHLLTILNDSSFISTSFLSNFYTFSIKNDPFLLKPILNLEKSIESESQITFEAHQLKKIIDCKIEDIPRIAFALKQLQKQVQWNLQHKKYFEKNGLLKYKSESLASISGEKLPSMKLADLPSQPSIKKMFSQIKKQKSHSLAKSNVLQRKASIFTQMSNTNNTISRKTFRINNPQTKNPFKLFDIQELKCLKQQIYNKVKDELDYETKKSIIGSKMFADLIDEQVRNTFQNHLNHEQQEILQHHLQITPLSFSEEEISSFITQIYKQIPASFKELQMLQSDLLKEINEVSYSYILKVHTKTLDVANIVAFCNRQLKQYKSIQIKFISFKLPSAFQKIVLKLVQFLWKYDNAKEITLNLRFNNEQSRSFVQTLSKNLEHNCTIIQKRHRGYVETKFVFMNKEFNKRYVHNPHPQKIHFKLYSALCVQKVQLQSLEIENLSAQLNYDYIIMEILRRFTNSEDFYILRDTFKTKDRFRFLLHQLMEIEKHKQFEVQMEILEGQNLTNLNHKLKYMKKPLFQASDLILINNIKMIQLEYTLTIAHKLQVLSTLKGQKCHRYAIHEELSCLCDGRGTQFYLLPVQESQHLKVVLFSAQQYLNASKKGLNMYLFQTLQKYKWGQKYVENLWVQMLRFPQCYTQREQFTLNTFRTHDFDSINKQLIIGDTFDWFTDIQIQNGISHKMLNNDLYLKKPLGVGVITNRNWILYCRILDGGQDAVSENA